MTEAEFVSACFKANKWNVAVLLEARNRIASGELANTVYQEMLAQPQTTGPVLASKKALAGFRSTAEQFKAHRLAAKADPTVATKAAPVNPPSRFFNMPKKP